MEKSGQQLKHVHSHHVNGMVRYKIYQKTRRVSQVWAISCESTNMCRALLLRFAVLALMQAGAIHQSLQLLQLQLLTSSC